MPFPLPKWWRNVINQFMAITEWLLTWENYGHNLMDMVRAFLDRLVHADLTYTSPPLQCSACTVLSLEGRSPSDTQVILAEAIQHSHWGIPEGEMSSSLDVCLYNHAHRPTCNQRLCISQSIWKWLSWGVCWYSTSVRWLALDIVNISFPVHLRIELKWAAAYILDIHCVRTIRTRVCSSAPC